MRDLDYREFALSRIDAFAKQVDLLTEIEFPYDDSADALSIISNSVNTLREEIQNTILTGDGLQSHCSLVNRSLSDLHRYIGYIKKSSDASNSFEIYFSFRRLVQAVFDSKAKLIVSSEWDYNLTYFRVPPELKDFTFIGLPVAESENPLIVPLSGHELGHSIWVRFGYQHKYAQYIQATLIKDKSGQFDTKELQIIADVFKRKCAEYFCDFIAIGLFGESFLYAFAYLLSPKVSSPFSATHPTSANRAHAMNQAMERMKFPMPKGFNDLFKTTSIVPASKQEILLNEAEVQSFHQIDEILNDAQLFLDSKKLQYKRCPDYETIIEDFLEMIPTSKAETLADITNAAWKIYFDDDKWRSLKNDNDKRNLLKELAVKSFEILEVKHKLSTK